MEPLDYHRRRRGSAGAAGDLEVSCGDGSVGLRLGNSPSTAPAGLRTAAVPPGIPHRPAQMPPEKSGVSLHFGSGRL